MDDLVKGFPVFWNAALKEYSLLSSCNLKESSGTIILF